MRGLILGAAFYVTEIDALVPRGDNGEFGGGLFAPDLPEATGQQADDFLLNLRIVQKAQKRLFEGLVLLGLLDLVFSFGSILHPTIMP